MSISNPIQRSSSYPLFRSLEQEYNKLDAQAKLLPTDDSDDEESMEQATGQPVIVHNRPLQAFDMTIESSYCGKKIHFKGNQMILWARDMMKRVIEIPETERLVKIDKAVKTAKVAIESSDDWLVYEGMFDTFGHLLAKPSQPFYGIATIYFNAAEFTSVEFKNKTEVKQVNGRWEPKQTSILYAHLLDNELVMYLKKRIVKYHYPANYGLSYRDIVTIIELLKQDEKKSDAQLASRQLVLLKGNVTGPIAISDRFLAFFNAILFGSETSRNSLSFVTGVLVLNMIAQEKLSYVQSFKSPEWSDIAAGKHVPYAVYPMASPYAGSNNFKAYQKLMESSKKEEAEMKLSSQIGMKSSRKHSQWSQIHIKEALLFKFWTKDWDHKPGWLNASYTSLGNSGSAADHGHAIEFARGFNGAVVGLLHNHFPRVPKPLVYSPDEMYALGWFKPSKKIWKDPENPHSTEVDFDAMNWTLSDAEPLLLEKCLDDAMWNIRDEIEEHIMELEGEDAMLDVRDDVEESFM